MILLAKRGDQVSRDLLIDDSSRLSIHLVAADDGFKWKITQSKIVEEANIKKWKGVGKAFVFKLGDNNPDIKEKLNQFLRSAGLEGDARTRFDERMVNVRDLALEKWGIRHSFKERK